MSNLARDMTYTFIEINSNLHFTAIKLGIYSLILMCETYEAIAPGTAKFNLEKGLSQSPSPVEYPFNPGLYFRRMSEIKFIRN